MERESVVNAEELLFLMQQELIGMVIVRQAHLHVYFQKVWKIGFAIQTINIHKAAQSQI